MQRKTLTAALEACRSPEAEAAEAQADAGMAAYRERKGHGDNGIPVSVWIAAPSPSSAPN